MNKFEVAKKLVARGLYLFPVVAQRKTPAIKKYTEKATDELKRLELWFKKQNKNIGIATSKYGTNEALLAIDIDTKPGKKGWESFQKLKEKHSFPKTLTQKTTTGGFHLIYKISKPIAQGTDVLGPGIDTRSSGGYLVGASSEIDGKFYTMLDAPIAQAPAWLIEMCLAASKSKGPIKTEFKGDINQGAAFKRAEEFLKEAPLAISGSGGDETTYKVATKLKDFGLTQDNAFFALSEYWNDRCSPPWAPDELEQKVSNAYAYGKNSFGAIAPEAEFTKIEKQDEPEALDPIEELNKRFGFLVLGGKSVILQKPKPRIIEPDSFNPFQIEPEVKFMGMSAFYDLLKPEVVYDKKGRPEEISKIWMSSNQKSKYERIDFLPGIEAPADTYNLWTGFSCEPLKDLSLATPKMIEGVKLFKEHMFENVCERNDELFEWLFGFFAHTVQKPWEKPLTALVFKGEKGVGKNALIDRVGKLFSRHFTVTSDKRFIVGNFNAHLSELLMIVLDEAFWSGDKQAEGVLKNLITGHTHLIEQKGREVYKIRNLLRVAILGNEDWIVPATRDERRFAVFNVGSNRRLDINFFSKMRELIDLKGGNQLLLKELLDFDLDKVNVHLAPRTEGLRDQKMESLNQVEMWWFSCLSAGRILGHEFASQEWPKEMSKQALREACHAFSKARGMRYVPNPWSFGKNFSKLTPDLKTSRLRDDSRAKAFSLLELEPLRSFFEQYIGHKIDWEQTTYDPEANDFEKPMVKSTKGTELLN